MGKVISFKRLTENLHISECRDGFWLYDETRGMNLSMRAKSPEDAFVEALTYYQERLLNFEQKYSALALKVDTFVNQIGDDDE